jgi:TolB-like protein
VVRGLAFIFALISLSAWAQTPPPAKERPRLLVVELRTQETTPQQAAAFTDGIVAAIKTRGLFEVISPRDVETLLGAERQRQLMGVCDTDPSACTDATAQLNTRFVLSGQLAKLGEVFQLTLQMVDTQKGNAVDRSTRVAGSLESLRELVPYAAAEATGMPLPPPPSRVLSVSLMVAGGGAIVAGGVIGLLALSEQQQLNDELCPTAVPQGARCTGVNLRPRDFYLAKQGDLANRQALSIGLLAGGAVLAGVGFWLMPPQAKDGFALQLSPNASGFSLAGVFP